MTSMSRATDWEWGNEENTLRYQKTHGPGHGIGWWWAESHHHWISTATSIVFFICICYLGNTVLTLTGREATRRKQQQKQPKATLKKKHCNLTYIQQKLKLTVTVFFYCINITRNPTEGIQRFYIYPGFLMLSLNFCDSKVPNFQL